MNNLEMDLTKIKLQAQEFEELAFDLANDRYWCRMHRINYNNPSFSEVKEKLYKELLFYEGKAEK